jgi:hypothetical protein
LGESRNAVVAAGVGLGVKPRWTPISAPPHNPHGAGPGKAMAGIREVRVTTTDGRKATVAVKYDDGSTQSFLQINY